MAIKFTAKQKITKSLYEEFKLQRKAEHPDEYFDYDYACFLERKITELMCDGKYTSNELPDSNCIKHAVMCRYFRCRFFKGQTLTAEILQAIDEDDCKRQFKKKQIGRAHV